MQISHFTVRVLSCLVLIFMFQNSFCVAQGPIIAPPPENCWKAVDPKSCADLYGPHANIAQGGCSEFFGCTGAAQPQCEAYLVGVGRGALADFQYNTKFDQVAATEVGEHGKDDIVTGKFSCYWQYPCVPDCDFNFQTNEYECLNDVDQLLDFELSWGVPLGDPCVGT